MVEPNLKEVQLHRSPIRDISAQPLSVPVKKTPEDLQMLFIRKRGVGGRSCSEERKEGDEVFTFGKQRDWLGSSRSHFHTSPRRYAPEGGRRPCPSLSDVSHQ